MNRRLLPLAVALALAAAGCDSAPKAAPRPDRAEVERRAPLAAKALGYTISDNIEPLFKVGCVLDQPYDQMGFQLAMDETMLNAWVVAGVVMCSTDEWSQLTDVLATAFQMPASEIAPLVAKATAAARP